jgi:serine protease inhibitor
MKKNNCVLFFFALLSGVLSLTSCEKNSGNNNGPTEPVKIDLSVAQKSVVDSANNFAFNLFKPIISELKGAENILISPFSVSSALTMTLNGAAGDTYEAMLKTLCLDGKTLQEINETYLKLMDDMVPVDDRVVMEIANSVWVEKKLTVKEPFMTSLQTYFKAETGSFDVTDPNAKNAINAWIEDKTHDKIKNMLENIEPNTVMFLINAIYFNGKWKYQFDKDNTSDKPFYLSSGTSENVPTMYNETNLAVLKTDNATIAELPYGQGNYTMVVILPDEGVTAADVAKGLDATGWQIWMNQLQNTTKTVHISLPKFKYGYKRLLNDDLSVMGMDIAFGDMADFTNIADLDLYISMVLHQAFIETNEEGTEAAAATIVGIGLTSVGPTSPIVLDINRPFLYFIREISTGTIVFMGKVENPAAE